MEMCIYLFIIILEINLRTMSKLLDIIRLSNNELKLLLGVLILSSVLSSIPFYLLRHFI